MKKRAKEKCRHMKKMLLILLAGMFLFTACADTVTDNSSVGEGVSEVESGSGAIKYTLVSQGKPYTKSNSASEHYSDIYDQQLTDGHKTGLVGVHYRDTRMVGFTDNTGFVIDLGDDGKRISAIVARSLEMHQDGVAIAASARFYGSQDGDKFKILGSVPFAAKGDMTVSEARFELKEVTDYRFVRVQIFKGSGAFFFTDEIEVYADVDPKETGDPVVEAYGNENIDRMAWKSLSSGIASAPEASKNIAVGAKYTFEGCGFDDRAPKNDTFLTDDTRTGLYFGDDVWVGLSSLDGETPAINVDLEKTYDNIYAFKVFALATGTGVAAPPYVDVYAKVSGNDVFAGRMYCPGNGNNREYALILPEYIKASSVRFVFPSQSESIWIEEVWVLAGYNQKPREELFDPLDFPQVTEDIYWDSNEPDFGKTQNLLLGVPQQISPLFFADIDTRGDESPASEPCLTDGKRADDTYCYGDGWFFSRGGDGLEIFYDLGQLSSVDSVNISFLEQTAWGISRPKYISVFLSDDGRNWYEVADWQRGDEELFADATRMELPFRFERTYAARFVRFRIESAFLFMDELECFGTKQVKSSATRLSDSGLKSVPFFTNAENECFADTQNTTIGAKDIMLVYGDRNEPEDLLPMVAYLDNEGNVKDTFMDGFLFMSHLNLPSGTLPHLENYMQDWEYVFDQTFNGKCNFGTLDETVGNVKEALGFTEYKVKVYIEFLTLHDSVPDFGDVDGDGITEDTTTSEGRKKILDWYIDKTLTEFESRDYQHIEFDGFYWVNEAVNWEKDDSHVIAEAAERVHAKGSNFLWVPYYKANRFFTGYELGFDAVCMQPNAVFDTDAPLWRIPSCAAMTKARKMCVEIEHSYQALGDPAFARTYMLYLYYGVLTGYMDAIHVYYDDVANFALMGYSDTELCRMQYDATYDFVKGRLQITPQTLETERFSASKDQVFDGTLNANGEYKLFTLVSAPKNGYIAFESDGSFRYFPNKGFTGTDTFTFTYNEFLGESAPCSVEITVG